jgi:hypothetical protein
MAATPSTCNKCQWQCVSASPRPCSSLRCSVECPRCMLLLIHGACWCSCTGAYRERVACRCAPGFYLAKPYAAGNAALTGCFCDLSNLHDLGDNEGRVEGVLTGGAMHDYTFDSTFIVRPAGKVRAAAGTSSLSPQEPQDMFRVNTVPLKPWFRGAKPGLAS